MMYFGYVRSTYRVHKKCNAISTPPPLYSVYMPNLDPLIN